MTAQSTPGLAMPWALYQRQGQIEARPWTADDAERYVHGGRLGLNTISVSQADHYTANCVNKPMGYVGRNPDNHDDQWYIAPDYFARHYAPVTACNSHAALQAQLDEAVHLLRLVLMHGERCNWFADRGDEEVVGQISEFLSSFNSAKVKT